MPYVYAPKRLFVLLLNTPRAPYSMLGHVTTITHKNNLVLSNIDPGAGGTSTKKVKIGNLPNIFDDDCSFLMLRACLFFREIICAGPNDNGPCL